jgi:hypothetical protein
MKFANPWGGISQEHWNFLFLGCVWSVGKWKTSRLLGDTNPVRVDVELPPPALAEMPSLVRTMENSEVNLANAANGGSLTLILDDAIQASVEAMLPPPAHGELSNMVSTMGGKLG